MLRGKVAIVTGGASGIGAATSRLLARQGARVVVTSELRASAMQRMCDEIIASGGAAHAIQCDITERNEVASMFAQVEREHGRLDILVQSAGVCHWGPFEDMPAEKIAAMFAVNVLGPISVMQLAIPAMRRTGGGAIVNIASGAAILGVGQFAAYAASKAAIMHFTRTLAPELRRSSIRVNTVGPGSVRTPMLGFTEDALTPSQIASLEKRASGTISPYGNAMMEPDDIAQVILFLVSDASRALQGSFVLADQGVCSTIPAPG